MPGRRCGKTGRRAIGQSRQLPAVAARQMSTRQRDLLLDQVEVIEQPGFRRNDPLPCVVATVTTSYAASRTRALSVSRGSNLSGPGRGSIRCWPASVTA